MKASKGKYFIAVSLLAGVTMIMGCSSNNEKSTTQATSTPTTTVSPTSSADDEAFDEYYTKMEGTWTSTSSWATYTFDEKKNFTKSKSGESEKGSYWFASDEDSSMIILCMNSTTEIENAYYKVTFDSDTSITLVNDDGETETWVKG